MSTPSADVTFTTSLVAGRFFDDPEWRFILADLDMVVLTLLDRLATNRTVTVTLNAPRIHEGRVLSNNPKVNILHTDGFPFLDEGDRFVFGLRRDGTDPIWTCRFAGIVDLVDTQAEGDNAYTRYVARDPRQLMYKRPVRDDAGVEPGSDGWTITGETGRDTLVRLLTNSDTYDGPTYIDFTGGTELNDTPAITEIVFQQGMTVGEAWDELERTGTIDTVLTPKFDAYQTAPITIVTLETYEQAGTVRYAVNMAWDKPGRTLVGVSNQRDGSGRDNEVRFHFGQGGAAAATLSDAGSQARFGVYFAERFFPGQTSEAAVDLIVAKQLESFRNGKRTVAATPAPRKAKQPFVEYLPGDRIAVNASSALLEELDTTQRVLVMPIQIDDEGGERVSGLLFTDDGWEGS